MQHVLPGSSSPTRFISAAAAEEHSRQSKRPFLPPADTGAVHPRGVSAITICNERGRHRGVRACGWFWRGSKVPARCSA